MSRNYFLVYTPLDETAEASLTTLAYGFGVANLSLSVLILRFGLSTLSLVSLDDRNGHFVEILTLMLARRIFLLRVSAVPSLLSDLISIGFVAIGFVFTFGDYFLFLGRRVV